MRNYASDLPPAPSGDYIHLFAPPLVSFLACSPFLWPLSHKVVCLQTLHNTLHSLAWIKTLFIQINHTAILRSSRARRDACFVQRRNNEKEYILIHRSGPIEEFKGVTSFVALVFFFTAGFTKS